MLQTLVGVRRTHPSRGVRHRGSSGMRWDAMSGMHWNAMTEDAQPFPPIGCEGVPQAEDQAKAAWRTRAGAIGGGSAASFRWQRIFLITSPCVMAAMILSDPC